MTRARDLAYEPVAGFRSRKAAQVSAFFVARSGGRIDKMKIAKLQYLAEREFLGRHARPMLYDELYSLPHGPICSGALNGVEGKLVGREEWGLVAANGRKDVVGADQFDRERADEVSDAEWRVISDVWDKFGHLTAAQLRAYTHNPANCPEYTEVEDARVRITYDEVFRALGFADAEGLARQADELSRLELAFH
jgi:uncharacterized phage-associated protein